MARKFDATLKDLIESFPADWLRRCGLTPDGPIEVRDADLATLTAAADKVLLVRGPRPYLVDLEPQASRDPLLLTRLDLYRAVLRHRYQLPVVSVVLLLRREADAPFLTGHYHDESSHGECSLDLRYRVVRVWEVEVESLLAGGLGTLPLAPISRVSRAELPAVIRRMEQRLETEVEPALAQELWTAAYVLLGLRYSAPVAAQLLRGVRQMKESTTYQAILAEGEARGELQGTLSEARRLLLRLGRKRLGEPSAAILARIEAVTDPETLERWIEEAVEKEAWEDVVW